MRVADFAMRMGFSASLAVSGVVHAYLYTQGYRNIPAIGLAFVLQASVFCAFAVLVLIGRWGWLRLAAAVGAGASLVAFGLSRTVGLFGFIERGWNPSPYAAISVAAELVTVVLYAVNVLATKRFHAARL